MPIQCGPAKGHPKPWHRGSVFGDGPAARSTASTAPASATCCTPATARGSNTRRQGCRGGPSPASRHGRPPGPVTRHPGGRRGCSDRTVRRASARCATWA